MKTMKVLIVLCIMVFSVTVSAMAVKINCLRGDANGDGQITIADVTAIQRKLLSVSVTPFNAEGADVDGKGLNLADAIWIQRYLVGYGNNPYHIGTKVYNDDDEYELPFIPAN